METFDISALKLALTKLFGGDPAGILVARAPGRVNLIGEHTDYNDGFVCPMAIETGVYVAARVRPDPLVRVASMSFSDEVAEFSLADDLEPGSPKWANYTKGVIHGLKNAGIPLVGADLLLANTLAVGAGLSSSAAVEVSSGVAMLGLAGETMDPQRLALICQKAEHDFAGVPCGIMDQTIVACGKKDHALLLDCRDMSKRFIPLAGKDLRVVILNTMVKHELSGGEYAMRRKQCEAAVEVAQKHKPDVRALRDVTPDLLKVASKDMDDLVLRRARHIVGENARVTAFGQALTGGKYPEAGRLMNDSHASLRDDYEVSCLELDVLADAAQKVPGVFGARMTGGGFGGCVVALCKPDAVQTLIDQAGAVYSARFGKKPEAYVTTATEGARLISK